MKKPIIKIAVPAHEYGTLETLATAVIKSMTGNANFASPSPSLSVIQTAATNLNDAITAWGTPGHRGSQVDFANLRVAAFELRNLLLKEAAYIVNLVDLSASAGEQQAFILSSGFQVKKTPALQGVLAPVENLRQFISKNLDSHLVKLNWSKPQGVTGKDNVRAYLVYRSQTTSFADAEFIAILTKATFTDKAPVLGAVNTYFVRPFNSAGLGVVCDGVSVSVPL